MINYVHITQQTRDSLFAKSSQLWFSLNWFCVESQMGMDEWTLDAFWSAVSSRNSIWRICMFSIASEMMKSVALQCNPMYNKKFYYPSYEWTQDEAFSAVQVKMKWNWEKMMWFWEAVPIRWYLMEMEEPMKNNFLTDFHFHENGSSYRFSFLFKKFHRVPFW